MKKDKYIPPFGDIPKARQRPLSLPLEERRGNFEEVEKGFTEEMALAEARRCLSCRKCIGCGLCLAECDAKAIEYGQAPEFIELQVDAIVLAPGTDKIDPHRQGELGYSRCHNVITSLELERILHPDGVYGGFILRPYDGEIPRSVAFVLCVGCRNEYLGANYCGSICCMTALKEAMAIKERIPQVKVDIFYRDIRPWGRAGEDYYLRARDQYGIGFFRAEVKQIEEDPTSKNLSLLYSQAAEEKRGEYELVVLSVPPAAPVDARNLAKKTGIKTNSYNFAQIDPFAPLETTQPGIYSVGSFNTPVDLSDAVLQARAATGKLLVKLDISSAEGSRDSCLIVGAGISGLTAALDLARQGINCYILEKEEVIGGATNQIHYLLDGKDPQGYLATLKDKVQESSNIRLLCNCQLLEVRGDPGDLVTLVSQDSERQTIKHAALILATGVREWQPNLYRYRQDDRIITQRELEHGLVQGNFSGRQVVMIQCVGSRTPDRPYCSRVCCAMALKNALKIKENNRDATIHILYQDMRIYGFEEEYLTKAIDQGIILIPWQERPELLEGEELVVKVKDSGGQDRLLPADSLILSSAGIPAEDNARLARLLGIEIDAQGFFIEGDTLGEPLATVRQGIYVGGWARRPCTVSEAICQGNSLAYQVRQWINSKR